MQVIVKIFKMKLICSQICVHSFLNAILVGLDLAFAE